MAARMESHPSTKSPDGGQQAATSDINSTLLYLRKDDLHLDTKPYRLQYDPGDALPQRNTTNETYPIVFRDLRDRLNEFSYEKNGFTVVEMDSKMKPEDFYDPALVESIYYAEVQALLFQHLHAKRVEILEHIVRKRHPDFPLSTGEDYQYTQPTSIAHVDYTLSSALGASEDLLKIDNSQYERFQCINIWKPLRGPLTDWPLAVCDAASVDSSDLIAADIVTRTGYTENALVYFNPRHEWYYLSGQMPSELMIFRQADTHVASQIGVPHSGFQNPHSNSNERPRESIETRAFIYY